MHSPSRVYYDFYGMTQYNGTAHLFLIFINCRGHQWKGITIYNATVFILPQKHLFTETINTERAVKKGKTIIMPYNSNSFVHFLKCSVYLLSAAISKLIVVLHKDPLFQCCFLTLY